MATIHPMRRLPLQGTSNTRDLGGYPCTGGVTRWAAFVRSDNPSRLTDADVRFLENYGICEAIDLRSKEELEFQPSVLCGAENFEVHHISVNNDFHGVNFEGDVPGSMAGLYMMLLDGAPAELVQVMDVCANAKGGVLFHCAVGKDRTGVIAMLLLKLAGVEDADVIADYSITEIYMREIIEAQAKVFRQESIPEYVVRSIPESMARVLKHLKDNYGTAEKYLLKSGMAAAAIARLKQRLVQAF